MRQRWVKVVVLVALTTCLVLAVGPLLGTVLILGTSLPFAVSNAVAGIVYALLIPLVALNTLYVYADVVVRDAARPAGREGERAACRGHPRLSPGALRRVACLRGPRCAAALHREVRRTPRAATISTTPTTTSRCAPASR